MRRPRTPSTASFSPMRCWTRCRWRAFAGSRARCEELGVAVEHDRLRLGSARRAERARRDLPVARATAAGGWDEGYVSEYCPRLPRLDACGHAAAAQRRASCGSITDCRARQYYLPERRDGTLLCHFRQRAHADPFCIRDSRTSRPGSTSRASRKPARRRASARGFTTQAYFLCRARTSTARCGISPVPIETVSRGSRTRRGGCAAGRDGRAVQGHGVARADVRCALRGFALKDLRHTL